LRFISQAKLIKIFINYTTHKHKSWCFILTSVISMVFVNISILFYYVFGNFTKFDPFILTLYMTIYFYCNAFAFQFICAAVAVRDRFILLQQNILAKRILNNYEVDLIIELYENLFGCLHLINSHLSFQLIPIMGYILASLIFTTYTIARVFRQYSFEKFNILPQHLIWIFTHIGIIMALIHASVSAMKAAKKIFNAEYEIEKYGKIMDTHYRKQFSKFVNLIRSNDLRLGTALFDFDWKLFMQV
jgi:hypothetical protein